MLGLVFVISLCLACSAEPPSVHVDPFPSADAIFKRCMSKSKSRSASSTSYDVSAIAKNVKQGTELVSDIQNAFEKVQEAGKVMGEVGAELFAKNDEILNVGKVIGQVFSNIGKYLGPALGGAGAAFAVLAIFVGQEGKSEELEAIERGFKEMSQRFDQVSTQITALDSKVDFYETIREYNKIGVIVRSLKPIYLGVLKYPTSVISWGTFNESCKAREADKALQRLHEIIVDPNLNMGLKPLVDSVVRYYRLDYPVIMSWFERMTQYAYILATVKSSCYGARYSKEDPAYGPDLAIAETQVKEIIQTLANFEEKFTNIDEEYVEFLKADLENAMKVESVTSADESKVNSLCDNFEANLEPAVDTAVCRGDASRGDAKTRQVINTRRVAVQARLGTKYFWLNWAVIVYLGEGTDHLGKPLPAFQCTKRQPGQHWYLASDSMTRGVLVSWTRKDRDMSQVRIQAADMIHGAMQLHTKETEEEREEHVMQEVVAWINKGPLNGKGAYCAFEKAYAHYYLSITTSGVMAHSRYSAMRRVFNRLTSFDLRFYNDYVVVFG